MRFFGLEELEKVDYCIIMWEINYLRLLRSPKGMSNAEDSLAMTIYP